MTLCGDDSDSRIPDSYATHSLDGDIKRQESGECVTLSTRIKNFKKSESVQNFDVELMCGIKSYGILAGTENHKKRPKLGAGEQRKKATKSCGELEQSLRTQKFSKTRANFDSNPVVLILFLDSRLI